MSWEAIFEVAGGILFLGFLAYAVIAPAKVGKPYVEGTEVLGSGNKNGDGGHS